MGKDEEDMAIRKEDLKRAQTKIEERKQVILEMTKKACDENDEGLRRLSKN